MTRAMEEVLEEQLIRHEGLKLKPYRCPASKLTIGVGRNLDDVGLQIDEVKLLLRNDIAVATAVCRSSIPNFEWLSDRRRMALIDMAFNLGGSRFRGFMKMRSAVAEEDFELAAREMEQSKWAGQVGQRAVTLAAMMREG
jgi:lysozyme